MQKIFYDKETGKEIVDVSGIKTKAEISAEFGLKFDAIEMLHINKPDSSYEIKNGKISEKEKVIEVPKKSIFEILKTAKTFEEFVAERDKKGV